MDRNALLNEVLTRSRPWDLLVIGGGATGVGCALDAATRGLDVLLLERNDLGSGTSARSTKLVHGGIRYLREGDLRLVREALYERGLLLANAPHIVAKRRFVVPCYSRWQQAFYGAGLKLYDALSRSLSFGRSSLISRDRTIELLPEVETEGLRGGIVYYDGQFDDSRLLIDMAVTAHRNGSRILNYACVLGLERSGGEWIVQYEDVLTGNRSETRARSVINACGAYVDPVRRMSDASATPVVTFARGTHLVLPRHFLSGEAALVIPRTRDGRVLFCIPWHDRLLVGTTDVLCGTAEEGDKPTDAEIDFLLETAGRSLQRQPRRDDVLSMFAGVRPLVSRGRVANTSKLSRSHELLIDARGLVTITGGKWTTYRRMAEEAVNAAVSGADIKAGPCATHTLRIDPPAAADGELLHADLPYTIGDIVRAVTSEMAVTLEDVLERRLRCVHLDARTSLDAAPRVSRIMREQLGISDEQIDLRGFTEKVEALNLPAAGDRG
ncbi:MAG: glycerol-3-phosphate dehydrogenase/oxidase [Acidobacteria bacterium]|nr:glycerol-3-phosphate dehydrogenase/oxidase [Acidobacteriota bacterium]MCW5948527.1 glycerol-3-phosphate dehydrogenase/oxidase [Pyrinomonadaceae bacterium]